MRYANWLAGAVHGDFGTTITGQPISDELGRRILASLRLLVLGSVIGAVLGVLVGAVGRDPPVPTSATTSYRCCRC